MRCPAGIPIPPTILTSPLLCFVVHLATATEGTFASAAFRTVQVDGDIHLAPSQFDLSLQKHLTAKVFAGQVTVDGASFARSDGVPVNKIPGGLLHCSPKKGGPGLSFGGPKKRGPCGLTQSILMRGFGF